MIKAVGLIGEHIILRPITPETDAPLWYVHMLDEQMHEWTGNKVPESVKEVQELLEKYNHSDGIIAWAIVLRETDEIIGTYWIGKPIKNDGRLIVTSEAQRLAKSYWRLGVMKEARHLIYSFIFNHLEVDEIHAQAWAENINSCESMLKSGFVCMKKEKRFFDKKKTSYDENHYVLTKTNYRNLDFGEFNE